MSEKPLECEWLGGHSIFRVKFHCKKFRKYFNYCAVDQFRTNKTFFAVQTVNAMSRNFSRPFTWFASQRPRFLPYFTRNSCKCNLHRANLPLCRSLDRSTARNYRQTKITSSEIVSHVVSSVGSLRWKYPSYVTQAGNRLAVYSLLPRAPSLISLRFVTKRGNLFIGKRLARKKRNANFTRPCEAFFTSFAFLHVRICRSHQERKRERERERERVEANTHMPRRFSAHRPGSTQPR